MSNFGEKIKNLRTELNMTQEQLGNKLNITYQAISKWERNLSSPDFETIIKISKIFNVSLNYFDNEGEGEK